MPIPSSKWCTCQNKTKQTNKQKPATKPCWHNVLYIVATVRHNQVHRQQCSAVIVMVLTSCKAVHCLGSWTAAHSCSYLSTKTVSVVSSSALQARRADTNLASNRKAPSLRKSRTVTITRTVCRHSPNSAPAPRSSEPVFSGAGPVQWLHVHLQRGSRFD